MHACNVRLCGLIIEAIEDRQDKMLFSDEASCTAREMVEMMILARLRRLIYVSTHRASPPPPATHGTRANREEQTRKKATQRRAQGIVHRRSSPGSFRPQ